jgi:hypothetical protein
MEAIKSLELDPLAFILDHPQLNSKPAYNDVPIEYRPYGDLDFLIAGVNAVLAYHDRSKWIYYYGYCNTLFISSRLATIHKAQSMATLMVLNNFRLLLDEFCSDASEVVFSKILPFVSRNLQLHEEHPHQTIEQFKSTLQLLTSTLLTKDLD